MSGNERIVGAYKKAFISEAGEILTELEETVLELETDKPKADLAAKVFMLVHTLHRSTLMFGFDDVSQCTRAMEKTIHFSMRGSVNLSRKILDLLLAAIDEMRLSLNCRWKGEPFDPAKITEITELLKKFILPPPSGRVPATEGQYPESFMDEALLKGVSPGEKKLEPVGGPGKSRIGELCVEAGLVEPSQVKSALVEQSHFQEVKKKRELAELGATVRVPSPSLDSLVALN